MHAVGLRNDGGQWGVGVLSRAGVLAWLSPDEARALARELEQMATITDRPGRVPGE